jgi:hypothetical protein
LVDKYLVPTTEEKNKNAEVSTPVELRKEMIDKLKEYNPEIFRNKEIKIFEPCIGKGGFVVDLIDEMMEGLKEIIKDEELRYKHIVENCIYMSELNEWNVYIVENLINPMNKYKINMNVGDTLELDIKKKWNLEGFDVIIGNPPYNENSNDKESRPIYNRFIETVIDYIKPSKLSMIVPSRWMLGGKGLDKFRNRMMNDSHIVKCNDYKNSYDIFPGVDIAVGVNYFLWDSEYNGPCNFNGELRYLNEFDVVVRDAESIGIITNVKSNNTSFLIDSVSVSRPYNIRTSEPVTESGILCLYTQKLGKQYVSQKSVTNKQNNINSWRVIVPIAPIAGQTNFNKPISIYNNNNIIKLPPSEICSEAYIVLKTLSSEYECDNFITYMKTKFFRFLLLLRIDGQNVSRDCYAWVPDQEDYSRSYNDEYLYQKYNLSPEQIEYIESKIKTIP